MPREASAGDRSGGVRRVVEQKTHLEAEDTLEGRRGVGSRSRVRDGKAWRKGVPLTTYLSSLKCILHHSFLVNRHIIALQWYYYKENPRSFGQGYEG